jgi:hypothetical protein
LYPNPTNKDVKIVWNDISPTNLTIANLQGMIIYEEIISLGADSVNIDVSSLAKGVYLVSLHTKEDIITKKLIVN